MRGSRDFANRQDYAACLQKVFSALNASRQERLDEERPHLGAVPKRPLDSYQRAEVRVSKWSTIRVRKNTYSVPSRLIGARLQVRMYANGIELWSAQTCLERIPRLHGCDQLRIDYRHLVDALVRKPSAFAHDRYRTELYPTHTFRLAYDALQDAHTDCLCADKVYLKMLHLAAKQTEAQVDTALACLLACNAAIPVQAVQHMLDDPAQNPSVVDVQVYDGLLQPPVSVEGVR
ncbi:MAG: hypothetical protein F4069_05820 [Rhodothermaceae bacterium]|nr:hypothetical protein [Rhodothermaceae bacterium]MYG68987.1 hypothetical protein [Rhodothermaceae bacterium]MYJ44831.1 hypothetical protein [Rhodothermaceae bacterium]